MNPDFPITDEILSAFLDGELNEEERRQVEHWLESSPDARRELAELRQIGALVRSIPRPSVPEGFQAELMQRVEREAGNVAEQRPPQAAAVSPNGRIVSPASPGRAAGGTGSWLAGLVSLAAVAGIVVAVGMFLNNPGREGDNVALDDAAMENAGSRDTMPDTEPVGGFGAVEEGLGGEESVATGEVPGPDIEPSGFPPSMIQAPMEQADGAPGGVEIFPPAVAETVVPPEPRGQVPSGTDPSAFERMLASREDPTLPLTPGEMTEFFTTVAGESVVVELYCVDVAQVENASNQLQVLLTANGIRSAVDYGVPVEPDVGFSEGDQVLIYVEADAQTIDATLAALNELRGVVQAEVNNLVVNPVADGNAGDQVRQGLDAASSMYNSPFAVSDAASTPGAADATDIPRSTQDSDTNAEDDANSRDVATNDEPTPTDPATAGTEIYNNGSFLLQNVDEEVGDDVIAGIEEQQRTSNSTPNSRTQMDTVRIASEFDRGNETADDEGIEGEGAAAVPPLPVQLIFVLRTAMP